MNAPESRSEASGIEDSAVAVAGGAVVAGCGTRVEARMPPDPPLGCLCNDAGRSTPEMTDPSPFRPDDVPPRANAPRNARTIAISSALRARTAT